MKYYCFDSYDDLTKPDISDNALMVLENRFLLKDENGNIIETPQEMFMRVANSVCAYGDDESRKNMAKDFYEEMANLRFLPNSPTLFNAGTKNPMLHACFVIPVEDSMIEIFDAVKNAAMIHKMGGGVGYDFSELRPSGANISTTHGISSGPISFMSVFSAASGVITAAGKRDGANMGVMRCDHPSIFEFLDCKKEEGKLHNFNLSVAITDEFMKALETKSDIELEFKDKIYDKVPAKKIWDLIVENAWLNGEPGIIFIDKINQKHPLKKQGAIKSTNPCGEQPLLPYEACILGSINVEKFYHVESNNVNFVELEKTVAIATRFLDYSIDVSQYPLKEIEEKVKHNRKIGLGIMGFANLCLKMGIRYGDSDAKTLMCLIMTCIDSESKLTSEVIAEEYGIPKGLSDEGFTRRNATLTTIAPTGTISIIANTSSGIEPLFDFEYTRRGLNGKIWTEKNKLVEKIILDNDGVIPYHVVKASDVTPTEHVQMQAKAQKWTDNSISKTINLPNEATKNDINNVMLFAYATECKGLTVYRDGSRNEQVLTSKPKDDYIEENIISLERDEICKGESRKMPLCCGNLYVTINNDESQENIVEVFATLGKGGTCSSAMLEVIGRLISLCARAGIPINNIIKQLKGVSCGNVSFGNGYKALSCPDAIAKALSDYIGEDVPIRLNGMQKMCPDCKSDLVINEGCAHCQACGYKKC